MKQAQNARKQRGRSPSRKGGGGKPGGQGNSRNEPKVRGNPKQLLEKYKTQAREAKQAGDRVMAEYYYQFADHYQRVLNELRGPNAYAESSDDDDFEVDGNREGNQESRSESRSEGRNESRNDNRGEGRDGGRGDGRRGRNRNGRQNGRDGDEAQAEGSNGGQDGEGETADERPARRGRGRGPRRNADHAVDPAKAEQPTEIHPELDLDGTVAAPVAGGEGVEGEKPKRRRATSAAPRKRTPRAKADGEGTDATEAPSPEDNAAA